jgi:hypothetical protein
VMKEDLDSMPLGPERKAKGLHELYTQSFRYDVSQMLIWLLQSVQSFRYDVSQMLIWLLQSVIAMSEL